MKYRRRERQERAALRQAERDKRTPEQQLARQNAAGWRCVKERARLEALIQRKKAA